MILKQFCIQYKFNSNNILLNMDKIFNNNHKLLLLSQNKAKALRYCKDYNNNVK